MYSSRKNDLSDNDVSLPVCLIRKQQDSTMRYFKRAQIEYTTRDFSEYAIITVMDIGFLKGGAIAP